MLGLLAAGQLPVGLLPEVGIPRLSVQVTYPNAAARTLETSVVRPLRTALLQTNGLTDIQSRTREESAVLELDFPFGTDPDLAFIEVNEKVDRAMSQLPRDLERPRVLATDIGDIPVVQVSVSLADSAADATQLLELSDLARRVLRRRLEQIPEIAFADLSGQLEPRIVVRPDPRQLVALGISDEELASLLRSANVEFGSLLLADGQFAYNLRFAGQLRTLEDVRQLSLRVGSRTLALGNLATVALEPIPPRGAFFYDGRPGVVFQIRKRADARLFTLQDKLGELLEDLRGTYPQLRFDLSNDQTAILRASISNLTSGLLYGAGFAILVLLLFFREWKRPLLIGLAVPIALVIATMGFAAFSLSLNVISLAGLILGLGLMIDNSIIVLDNIQQFNDGTEGLDGRIARATNEVIRPLLASALTTVAVFLPLVLLSGIAGALFKDQALSITLSLAASLLVAYLLLPTLVYRLDRWRIRKRKGETSVEQSGAPGAADAGASSSIKPTAPAPRRPSAGQRLIAQRPLLRNLMAGLFLLAWGVLGYFLVQQLPRQTFPELTRAEYQLDINWNEAIPLAEHIDRSVSISRDWRRAVGGHSATLVGEDQFMLATERRSINVSELQLFLQDPSVSPRFADGFLAALRQEYPGASITFRPIPNLFDRIFLNDEPLLELRLRSAVGQETPRPNEVQGLLAEMSNSGFAATTPPTEESIRLSVDLAKLNLYRVDPDRLQQRLLTLFSENEVTRLRANDREIPILLTAPEDLTRQELRAANVPNQNGDLIPIQNLVRLEREIAYRQLTADRVGEYLSLVAISPPPDGVAPEALIPESTQFVGQFSGRMVRNDEQLRDLVLVMSVSFLLLYLILAAQFEHLFLPLIVLLVVPISLVGALIMLQLMGASLNLISIIGMVVTGGIVVNDAIIKVDMIERARKEGQSLEEAISLASRRRFRAIVMTSLTTMLALTPVLFTAGLGAELQRPLALTVLGGLVVGTLGSLYLIPVFYRWFVVLGGRAKTGHGSPVKEV